MAITNTAPQSAVGTAAAATTAVCTITATTAGSVLFAFSGSDSFGVSSISGGGATWSLFQAAANNHNLGEIWIGVGASAGTTTYTVTYAGITNAKVHNLEVFGLQASPGDTSTTGTGTSTAPAAGPITPTVAVNIVLYIDVTNTAKSAGPSGGFTQVGSAAFTGTREVHGAFLIQAAATAATCGYTITSAFWDSGIRAAKGVISSAARSQAFIY